MVLALLLTRLFETADAHGLLGPYHFVIGVYLRESVVPFQLCGFGGIQE